MRNASLTHYQQLLFVEKSRIADNVAGAKCMSTVNDKGQG